MKWSWARRSREPELMDDPEADETKLLKTVRQFRLINRLLSRFRHLISRHILDDADRRGLETITVLDLGAGGCDVADWLVEAGRRRGTAVEGICLDSDPRIVAYAREVVAQNPKLTVVQSSADQLSGLGEVDYLFSNHFLHHLDDGAIVALLPKIHRATRYGFVLSDLKRSLLSYLGYLLLAALLFRGGFALEDGLRSIRRGFRRKELEALLEEAGLGERATVRSLFPGRLAVVWTAPE